MQNNRKRPWTPYTVHNVVRKLYFLSVTESGVSHLKTLIAKNVKIGKDN